MKFLVAAVLAFGLYTSAQAACTVEFNVENATTAPVSVGQSYTAECSGLMTSITVKADTPVSGLMTLKIYNGQSLAAGDLLYTQNGNPALVNGENQYNISPSVSVITGQQYTFIFTDEGSTGIRFRYDTTNSYAGGQATAGAGFVPGSDIWFRINIADAQSVPAFSEWGMVLFSVLLGIAGVRAMRKGRSAT